MWDKLRKQVEVERAQLHQLLEAYRVTVEKTASTAPSDMELYALAGLLHSFYNGIENIFKRVAEEVDGQLPRGPAWHRQLLDTMSQPGKSRPAVISASIVERLDAYLDFRHFFRHSYVFHLRWDMMKALVLNCEETLGQLEAELDLFLAKGE